MGKKMIPQDVILQEIHEINEQLEEMGRLEERRDFLESLLTQAVDVPDEADSPKLTDQIIQVVRWQPGMKSAQVAEMLINTGATKSAKVVQTIIGQLVRRDNPPLVRQGENLYPSSKASSEFEDFPQALQEEDDDLPF